MYEKEIAVMCRGKKGILKTFTVNQQYETVNINGTELNQISGNSFFAELELENGKIEKISDVHPEEIKIVDYFRGEKMNYGFLLVIFAMLLPNEERQRIIDKYFEENPDWRPE